MTPSIAYTFKAKVWQYESPGGWVFVSLPVDISGEIRTHLKSQEEGWGRMQAKAAVNGIEWNTAIWFDTKRKTYLLPIKADIREKTGIVKDQEIEVKVWV